MKQSLQLKLSQHLTLTPQLQQSIKLLQLSTIELNQEIERFLLENPMLERVDESATGAPAADRDTLPSDASPGSDNPESPSADYGENEGWHEAGGAKAPGDDEDRDDGQFPAAEQTLQQHLIDQLMLLPLSEFDRRTAILLIAHINDDGYLPEDLSELAADAAATWGVGADDLSIARKLIQSLEPTGIGAQSLRECLILQIDALAPATLGRALARTLVDRHLDLLASHDYSKLRRQLRCSEDELREASNLVTSLDPKPGSRIGSSDVRYVIPDVIVKKLNGRWQARLNSDVMPRLRVNKLYADLLQRSRDGDGRGLSAQLQEARWLIKNVQQRFDTILRVTQAIVEQQRHFFEHGEVAMRPLVLREIAEQVGLHESTISRVTTQKYMLTPRGIFELKYFFGSSLATDAGGACSSTAIRALIKQLVQAEDCHRPLSDHRISGLLAEQGITVARRTVAKYRESMQIQAASQRKAL